MTGRQRTREHLTTAVGRTIAVHRASPITGKVKFSSKPLRERTRTKDSAIHPRESTEDKRREAAASWRQARWPVAAGARAAGTRGLSVENTRRPRAPHGAARDGSRTCRVFRPSCGCHEAFGGGDERALPSLVVTTWSTLCTSLATFSSLRLPHRCSRHINRLALPVVEGRSLPQRLPVDEGDHRRRI